MAWIIILFVDDDTKAVFVCEFCVKHGEGKSGTLICKTILRNFGNRMEEPGTPINLLVGLKNRQRLFLASIESAMFR